MVSVQSRLITVTLDCDDLRSSLPPNAKWRRKMRVTGDPPVDIFVPRFASTAPHLKWQKEVQEMRSIILGLGLLGTVIVGAAAHAASVLSRKYYRITLALRS